jgi:hypothetical protein
MVLVLTAVASLAGCGGGGGGAEDVATAPDGVADLAADAGSDGPAADGADGLQADAVTADVGGDAGPDLLEPLLPFGPENRGYTLLRGIVHLHSAYSHDGCAPDGYEDFGGPDPACIGELRAALCAGGIDFAMQTDHPGFSEGNPYLDVIHYDAAAGDTLAKDEQDRPFANRIQCPEGSPVSRAWFFLGTEGHKNMPIGVAGPDVPSEVYHGDYGDEEPLDVARAAVAVVHGLGGYAFAAHTEENNISLERIIALPLDGMEIYNLHANLMGGLEDLDSILSLDRFMSPGATNPDPDLALLPLLAEVPEDVEKFEQAGVEIRLAAVAATDIHRNVEVPALCPGGVVGSLCEPLAADYPNFVEFAQVGGPLPLSDGDRMDSYLRGFRWFSNWTLAASDEAADMRAAIGSGRSFAAFDLFGAPVGFDFFAVADGKAVEMGQEVSGAGQVMLYLRTPRLGEPAWKKMPGIDFAGAILYVKVVRSFDGGVEDVLKASGQDQRFEIFVTGPGMYRVEIAVKPKHLEPALKGVEDFASKKYPYIYSNAVFVR